MLEISPDRFVYSGQRNIRGVLADVWTGGIIKTFEINRTMMILTDVKDDAVMIACWRWQQVIMIIRHIMVIMMMMIIIVIMMILAHQERSWATEQTTRTAPWNFSSLLRITKSKWGNISTQPDCFKHSATNVGWEFSKFCFSVIHLK